MTSLPSPSTSFQMKKVAKTSKPEKSYFALECDKIGEIAIQYGFSVVKGPAITTAEATKAKAFHDYDYYGDADEKVALLEWYIRENLQTESQPVMIHYKKPLQGSNLKKKPSEEMYGLDILGSARSTSEALILKTILAILSDLGHKDLYIEINSIGDKESISRFEREMSAYCRKHLHEVPVKFRDMYKKNHYAIITDTSPETEQFRSAAPQSVGTLSELSRMHFKEVLEYLEAFGIPYRIKPSALSNKTYATQTVFEIRTMDKKNSENSPILAYGYRYNYLAKKIGGKRDIPCIGATIIAKKIPTLSKKVLIKNIKKPRFYLVQIGPSAKLKALNIIEALRKQKISVYHSLTKDKITGQLSGAEYMHASHVLIIGQKEAIENTVVVRDVSSREQETVPMASLADFLKNIK